MIISQPKDVLEGMDSWCKATFTSNGLLQEIRSSKITMQQAENEVVMFVSPKKGYIVNSGEQLALCANSMF